MHDKWLSINQIKGCIIR